MENQLDFLNALGYDASITKSGWYSALTVRQNMARHKTKLGFYKRFTTSAVPGTGWFLVDQVDKDAWGPYDGDEDNLTQWKRIVHIIEGKWKKENGEELPDNYYELINKEINDATSAKDEPKGKPEKLPARRTSK